jgi:hypothetical protein
MKPHNGTYGFPTMYGQAEYQPSTQFVACPFVPPYYPYARNARLQTASHHRYDTEYFTATPVVLPEVRLRACEDKSSVSFCW